MFFNCLCSCHFIEITSFICTDRINLLNLNQSSDQLVIVAKGFLELKNLHMLIKQEPSKESTKANLLYLLYSTIQRGCLLHLIKKNCLLKTFLRTVIWSLRYLFIYLLPLVELVWDCIIFLYLPRWLKRL